MSSAVDNVLKLIKDRDVKYIDFMFGDLFGTLQHVTFPASQVTASLFEAGIPFDGSSIRGWKGIEASDMLMKPDAETAFIDPFRAQTTLAIMCEIWEPRTNTLYDRCPRSIARKALAYLQSTGIGDIAYFGPEPEFFIFDSIRYSSQPNGAFYEIESGEAPWTTGDEGPNLGHKIRNKMGYFPVTPQDTLMDLRSEITTHMMEMGMEVQLHHHEVATAGQCEIGVKFGTIITASDNVHKYKYAVKNTCFRAGKTATFMPKPMFGDNGSGMHCHTSIWKDGKNLFAGTGYGDMSQTALWAIGGIIKHGRAIQVFTNPTANSYRRLIPGYEAPVNLAYSATNRSASIRIPYAASDAGRRFEFRCPDGSGSPYLVTAAILMAMIDGIQNKIDPGQSVDKNLFEMPADELAKIPRTCKDLETAHEELLADPSWILAGGVFTEDTLEAYMGYRRETEIEPLKIRPNPYEFETTYDC